MTMNPSLVITVIIGLMVIYFVMPEVIAHKTGKKRIENKQVKEGLFFIGYLALVTVIAIPVSILLGMVVGFSSTTSLVLLIIVWPLTFGMLTDFIDRCEGGEGLRIP